MSIIKIVIEIKGGVFTPLFLQLRVEALVCYKKLAEYISFQERNRIQSYELHLMYPEFSIIGSAIVCLRGTRLSFTGPEIDLGLGHSQRPDF